MSFLASLKAAQARLSLHLPKCHIVGNHMSRLKYIYFMLQPADAFGHFDRDKARTFL